jgi:hypothetical protein
VILGRNASEICSWTKGSASKPLVRISSPFHDELVLNTYTSKPQAVVTVYITPPEAESTDHTEISSKHLRTIRMTKNATSAKNPIKYIIHKEFICYYSPFFKAAFNGNFKEGQTQEITISADVVAFGVVVNWLYSQKVVTSGVDELILSTLAQAWILADRFLIPKLQNQIMFHIHKICICIGIWKDCTYFETFANIAWTYGDGNNELFAVGAWALVWVDKGFVDRLSDEIPLAMFRRALEMTKGELHIANLVPAKQFYVNESTTAGN